MTSMTNGALFTYISTEMFKFLPSHDPVAAFFVSGVEKYQ